MPDVRPRKLATIVALDVAGYSARTEADEAQATADVAQLRGAIGAIAARHGGRIFNTAGDGFMLEFGSSAAAVEAAIELADTCEPKVRVGVHLGDVVVQPNGDLLGHGVNVAARLMAQAMPGSALVSADVRRTIRGPLTAQLISSGILHLDKMSESIEAFALSAVATVAVADHARGREPVLAVLPFDNLSNDPDMQFFSDGVADEILQVLMNYSELKVIGRTSAFHFRGAAKAGAARELKATHVLDGAVRKAGARLRVNAQLTEASTGTALWAERFEREAGDVFAVQDDIAANVARALRQTLSRDRPLLRIDPAAYELYLKARALMIEVGFEARREAARLLEDVVSREPGFAKGWAMLAAARGFLLPATRDSVGEPEHTVALGAANRALAIDPKCAEGYRALAMLKPAFGEYAEKVRLVETAVELSPNDHVILGSAGVALLSVGRSRAAQDVSARAISAEPLSPFHLALHASALWRLGQRDEAMAILENAWRRFPDSTGLWIVRWDLLILEGRLDEAERMCEPGVISGDVRQFALAVLRLMHAVLRADHAARRPLLEMALPVDKHTPFSLAMASFAAFAGHADLAFERLFAALDIGAPISAFASESVVARAYTTSQLFHFRNEAMQRDPRFARVCARLGLVDYWRESGKWPDCAGQVPYDFKAECEAAARAVDAS